jgi:hypothetical protein
MNPSLYADCLHNCSGQAPAQVYNRRTGQLLSLGSCDADGLGAVEPDAMSATVRALPGRLSVLSVP